MFLYHASGRSNYPGHSQFLLIICFIKTRSMWATLFIALPFLNAGESRGGLSSVRVKCINTLALAGCISAHCFTITEFCTECTEHMLRPSPSPETEARHPLQAEAFISLHNRSLQIRVIEWNWGNIYSSDICTYLTKSHEAANTHIWEHI